MFADSIGRIKVPNGFVFDLQQAENLTPVRKNKTFCEVNLLRYKDQRYALKTIIKANIPEERYEQEYRRVANEINTLYKLSHPNVIRLFFHEETADEIRLLMEYGGIRLRGHFKATYHCQDEVRMITTQILEGLKYIHEEGFIHRDLEPENILINKQEQRIKLIDFGFIDQVAFRKTQIGSYEYMAPEITGDNPYNQKVDIWSLGIIVYEMLHQDLPFCTLKKFDRYLFEDNRRNLIFNFDPQISPQAVSFIKRMLVIDPEERASAAELLKHEFIQPQEDLSIFDREGTDKTHKYQYNREPSQSNKEESIEELEGQIKKTVGEVFACLHHQKDTLSELLRAYRLILTNTIQDKQRK